MATLLERAKSADALVIGGGPAGLAAATRLKRLGLAGVIVADRELEAGGVPRHCGHPPFGMREFGRVMTGPKYARRLVKVAKRAGVEFALGHSVVAIERGERLVAVCATSDGPVRISAKRIIIATGVRETPRSARLVTGDRPLGILNTGALQAYAYLKHLAPFRRPVIAGTELVALSSLLTCRKIGAQPVAMIEERERPTTRRPFMALPRLLGVPVRYGTTIADIKGRQRVEAVTLARADGTSEDVECDGVLFTGRFRPEASLARAAGLEIDTGTGGPTIDQFGRTSDARIFAAGNVLHPVETAGWSWQEGVRVADFVGADLFGWLPSAENAIRIIAGDGVRYVVPQRFVPSEGGLPHIQLRASDDISGALVARSGSEKVHTQTMRTGPERRILAPRNALRSANADVTFSFDGIQASKPQGGA
ncbi:NAD(P)/FAD-dependent oxidoreductase [Hyphomicrobium sp.]|uniref:NAD(P)/FAD-dependent oxidoreductase n=1 Tax=Hyphomicrobium sp. TaxID=82 RepID=UPI002D7830DC|nr:FAD-dependent oxidoreductase [Hyphomicrobium sp.]HET6389593.1 FAD-dependent oxidoreductase [Hyphomicrobium sp.]